MCVCPPMLPTLGVPQSSGTRSLLSCECTRRVSIPTPLLLEACTYIETSAIWYHCQAGHLCWGCCLGAFKVELLTSQGLHLVHTESGSFHIFQRDDIMELRGQRLCRGLELEQDATEYKVSTSRGQWPGPWVGLNTNPRRPGEGATPLGLPAQGAQEMDQSSYSKKQPGIRGNNPSQGPLPHPHPHGSR